MYADIHASALGLKSQDALGGGYQAREGAHPEGGQKKGRGPALSPSRFFVDYNLSIGIM